VNRAATISGFEMSDNGDPDHSSSETDSVPDETVAPLGFTEPAAVERRVWRNIFAVIAMATVVAAIFADLRFMLGLILGGGLALLNYKWLHASLRAILDTGSRKAPPGTTLKFMVRWLVIAAVAWIGNQTGYVDAVAILAGLFAPAVAVMIEAAYVTYKTLTHRKGER